MKRVVFIWLLLVPTLSQAAGARLAIAATQATTRLSKGDADGQSAKAVSAEAQKGKLVVTVDAHRRVFIGDVEVALDQLEGKLKSIAKSQADVEVYVDTDRVVPYAVVAQVTAAVARVVSAPHL